MPVLASSRDSFIVYTNVSSLDVLVHVTNESVVCNLYQLVGTEDDTTIVSSQDWARFLSSPFHRLSGIKQCHHFHFEWDHPVVVFLKKSGAVEEAWYLQLNIWSPSPADNPPPLVTATWLSLERRKHLFEKIREYCCENSREALTSARATDEVPYVKKIQS